MLRAAVTIVSLLVAVVAQDPQPVAAAREPTLVLEGRVVDLRGEPVPAARLQVVTGKEPDTVLAKGVCDGDGYFRIAKVPPRSSWLVQASSPGRCQGQAIISGEPKPVTIKLHDAATVRGVLRNRAGEPVAKAVVRAELTSRILSGTRADAATDAEGRFELRAVPLGLVRLAAVVAGEGLAELQVLVGGDAEVAIASSGDPTTSLRIVVEGLPDGAHGELSASILPYGKSRLAQFPPPWSKPIFDPSGVCELTHVPDLRYQVSPRAAGFAFEPREIRGEAGKGPHVMKFVARKLGSTALQCPARLQGPDDKPVAGVKLAMRAANGGDRAEAISAEDGTLTFASPLANGTPVIVYSLDDRWVLDQAKGDAMAGAHDLRFLVNHECKVDPTTTLALRVLPACTVKGCVVFADGRPAPFVPVQLEEENDNRMPRWMTFARTTTDRNGNFLFARCHHLDSMVRVLVESPDGAASSEAFSLARSGTNAAVAELKLSPAAMIEGTVVDAQQKPAAGIRVWLRDWDFARNNQKSGSVVEVITDRLGRYRFVGVPPGGAWLQLLAVEDHALDRAVEPFEVEAGKTYPHDLQVPAK